MIYDVVMTRCYPVSLKDDKQGHVTSVNRMRKDGYEPIGDCHVSRCTDHSIVLVQRMGMKIRGRIENEEVDATTCFGPGAEGGECSES